MSKKISEILQQKLQQKQEKPKNTTTKTTTSTKRTSKYDLLEKRFEDLENKIENILQQKLQPDKETEILFEITDPSEYASVKFAIAKCMNLFKASKYDSPSSSMKDYKENWKEITIRQEMIEKKKDDKKNG